VNSGWKYWVLGIALALWLGLAWGSGGWLNLRGNDLWLLRGTLTFIGLCGFITAVWWFRMVDRDRASQMLEEEAAGRDEIDVVLRKAQVQLRAMHPGAAVPSDLPAILLLGETGSAKTSIVLNCGLGLHGLVGPTGQSQDPTPTRALNLWFLPPFMVAEAGGPLLHEPPRWAHMVKRVFRGGSHGLGKDVAPPRLALVCIDCEKVFTGSGEALGTSIAETRARLRETSQLLGINLPVYVLLTRADRLHFFQEFVAPFSDGEVAHAFGAALPVAAYTGDSYNEQETAAVASAFDELVQSAAAWRLTILTRNLDAAQALPIYEFSRELKKLRATLVPMLVDVCRPGASRTTPFLRGFYFTGIRPLLVSVPRPAAVEVEPEPAAAGNLSATRMFDIKAAKAAAAKLMGATETVETQRLPQWVFLRELFSEVLWKDSTALTTSTFSTRIGNRRKFMLGASMGLLLIITTGIAVSSIRNKQLEYEVTAAAQDLLGGRPSGPQTSSANALNKLEALRQSVETLTNYECRGAPLSMRWGLYVGNSLLPNARNIYFRHFREMLLEPAQSSLAQTLLSLPLSPGPSDRYDPAFDLLKAYLLTTAAPEKSDPEFLSPILLRALTSGRDVDAPSRRTAQRQFDFYAAELRAGNPFPSLHSDGLAVARARHFLMQFSGNGPAYRMILSEADRNNPPLNFNHKFPGAADVISNPSEVSGAFTKAGWAFVQSALEYPARYFDAEAWVLGKEISATGGAAKRIDTMRTSYKREYVEQWRSFLRDASVVHPLSLGAAAQELQRMTADASPLLTLFCVAAQNTAVDDADIIKAFQAVQSVTSPDCQEHGASASSATYLKSLSDLQACVERADSAPSAQKDSAKAQCLSDVARAEQSLKEIAKGLQPDPAGHADQTVKDLLRAPLDAVASLVRPGPVSAAALCAQMAPLESRFPFNAQASPEVSLTELTAVYAPSNGALSQFYSSVLADLLLPKGAGFVSNPTPRQKASLPFLSFFNRSMAVQHTFFGAGGSPQFHYALRPAPTENVSSLNLTIDGKSLAFEGSTAPFTSLTWPAASGQGVRLTVKIPGGAELGFPSYEGLWAVFRFFADATVVQHNGNIYTLQWVLGGERPVTAPNGKPVTVQIELDTQGAMPIFEKGFMSGLHCVPVVTQ